MIQYAALLAFNSNALGYWMPAFAGMTARPYLTAENRLSNEFEDTIGWEPSTQASFAGAGAGSETVGLNGGRTAVATLVSAGFGAVVFGTEAEGRGVASTTFGLAGTAVEVVSLANPTFCASLLKKPSDLASGAAE